MLASINIFIRGLVDDYESTYILRDIDQEKEDEKQLKGS